LTYEKYFSKTRKFTDERWTVVHHWLINEDGTVGTVYFNDIPDPGYALCHDDDGFFIVSYDNNEGLPAKLSGSRREGWLYWNTHREPLEVIWEVPNSANIDKFDYYLTDGRYIYYVQYKQRIYRVDMLTGERYLIHEADRIMVENDSSMVLYNQDVLIFLTQSSDTVSINRLYLPTQAWDVLYDQIPLDSFYRGFNVYCSDSDTLHWTTMEPKFLDRLWEIVHDPDSSFYSKHDGKTVKYHELFGGTNSIMNATNWKALSGHPDFIELVPIMEMYEEIPALLHCSYNIRTGEYTETPYYWDNT
jgi:hypothetical protein